MKNLSLSFRRLIVGVVFMPGILSPFLNAQDLAPSFSLSARYGITPYEYINGFGGSIHLDYPMSQRFYLSGGLGFIKGKTEVTLGEYSHFQREAMTNVDLIAFWNLTPLRKRNRLGVGLGGSVNWVNFEYAREVSLPMIEMNTHHTVIPMINLVVEEVFYLKKHWGFICRFTGRSSLSERAVLERNISNGRPSTIGGIRNSFAFDLGMIYKFVY